MIDRPLTTILNREFIKKIRDDSDAAIPEIPVKAEVLREMADEILRYKDMMARNPAITRDPREGGRTEESFALMSHMKRISQQYRGRDFAMMENTVDLVELAFLCFYTGEHERADRIISALDGGWARVVAEDFRKFEKAEEHWLTIQFDEESNTSQLTCSNCNTAEAIKGHAYSREGHNSAQVFYSNHRPYDDKRPCRGVEKKQDR